MTMTYGSIKYGYLVMALLLYGCSTAPASQVGAFGQTTSALTEKIARVMDEYNSVAMERMYTDYAATYNHSRANKLTSHVLAELQSPITVEHKKNFAIYQASKALGIYFSMLRDLASASSREDVDIAAANLYGSVKSLNEQYGILYHQEKPFIDEKNLARTTTLIGALGSALIERKRRAVIKSIVIDMEPNIARICNTIHAQLKNAQMGEAIASSRQYILSEEVLDYKSQLAQPTTLEWRRQQIRRLHELQQGVVHSKLLVQQTQKAVEAVQVAHTILAEELKKDRFSSAEIVSTIGQLKLLNDHYDDFEKLLLSCKTITQTPEGLLSCADS